MKAGHVRRRLICAAGAILLTGLSCAIFLSASRSTPISGVITQDAPGGFVSGTFGG